VQSRHSSNKTLFVRTQVAIYFVSLLICNLIQAVGGLLNIAWIVEGQVYTGVACTAQAVIKEIGSVRGPFTHWGGEYLRLLWSQIGTPIFTFVIGAHTFSLLFLRRKYSDRTCYLTLSISWGLVLLESCIENFILAKPKDRGPYHGIAGYWCWITPIHRIERYTTSYLCMFVSAAFSFILYSLVFFRLRGNISVSTGYKFSFHRRPKVKPGRTSDGTYITAHDQRIESHLTTAAKHMMWYPVVYTVLVLPMAASRLSTFSGLSVPIPVTMFTAAVFMLHGFFNTVLFCTTRDILPGSWRQRFGFGTTRDIRRGDVGPSSRTDDAWFTVTRPGTVDTGTTPAVRSVGIEKDVEKAEPSASYVRFCPPKSPIIPVSPTSPTPLLQAHSGGHRGDTHDHHIRRLSSSAPQDTSTSIHFVVDEDDEASDLSIGGRLESIVEWELPQRPGRGHMYRPAPGSEKPSSIHPLATSLPLNTETLPIDVLDCCKSHSPFLGKWRFWRRQ